MKFKDLNNNVHEIEAGFENLLPKGSVEITQAEADVLLAPPAPTKQEIIKSISDALQQTMEDAAIAKGYDSLLSVISYSTERLVPAYQADGISFLTWRSGVWAYAYGELAKWKAGGTQPTLASIITGMPKRV